MALMQNIENYIRAYALKNSIEFGKASPEKVLTKLFQHGLEKTEIKKVMPSIQKIVSEINKLSPEQKNTLFEQISNLIPEKEGQNKELQELPEATKNMVFRAAPFPSGALHIGNAKTFLINALYAEKYNGKILLVMDDTIGSKEKQLIPEAYKLIEQGLKWLGVNFKRPIIYKSKRLKIYYKYAKELIKKDKAYVCYCPQETLRENREKGIECGCRQLPVKIQLERWKQMFKEKEGHATLRIKTNMMHPNPAFRDRVLFKISDRKHPRVKNKYRVWPTLEMSWAVDDHLLGITHIIRGAELQIETDMEKHIWDIFHWKHPVTIHTGFVTLEGIDGKLSKSKAQEEVKSGQFTGWDDPRTWSIQSLKRRGIKPEAIREFVKSFGLNKSDITAPIENLYALNRKIIDKEANRYSFIRNPIKLEIEEKIKVKEIEVPLHPDRPAKRTIKIKKIFISKDDFEKYKGAEVRLLHLYNIRLDNNKPKGKITSIDNKDIPKINWVSENVHCSILMPNGEWIDGIAEQAIKTLKKSEIVQFERFGFVRFDKQEKKRYEFWFAHR